jgi:Arc/MetJ-type ribon-helix-helix transcriptional regulator
MYKSVSEVVRETSRQMEDPDNINASRLHTLQQEINKGVVSLDIGEGRSLDVELIKEKGRKILSERGN